MHEARLRAALRMHGSHRCRAIVLLSFLRLGVAKTGCHEVPAGHACSRPRKAAAGRASSAVSPTACSSKSRAGSGLRRCSKATCVRRRGQHCAHAGSAASQVVAQSLACIMTDEAMAHALLPAEQDRVRLIDCAHLRA